VGGDQATSTAVFCTVSGGRQHQQLSPGWWVEAGNINSSLLGGGWRQATSIALLGGGRRQAIPTAPSWWWAELGIIQQLYPVVSGGRYYQQLSP
jgi:hypothetical protein